MVRPEVVLMVELHDQKKVMLEFDVWLFDDGVQFLPQSTAFVDHYDRYGERQFDQKPVHEKGDREDAGRAVLQREALPIEDPHFVDSKCSVN